MSFPPSHADLKAQIIEIRGEAKVRKVRERMEGEIVRHEKSGETRISTDKGEITVRIQSKTPPPEGTRVELDIPAGNPPRQATVRVQPEKPVVAAPHPQTPEQSANTLPQNKQPAPPLTPETEKNLRDSAVKDPIPNIRPAPLLPDSLIRLVPFSGTLIQNPLSAEAQTALPPIAPTDSPPYTNSAHNARSNVEFPLQSLTSLLTNITMTPRPLSGQAILSAPAAANEQNTLIPFQTRIKMPVLGPADTLPPLTSLFIADSGIKTETDPPSSDTLTRRIIDARITGIIAPPILVTEGNATDKILQYAPSPPPPLKAGENTGTIIGKTPDGLPVLSLMHPGAPEPLLFVVQFNASNLPTGTAINFIPESKSAISQTAGPQTAPPNAPFALAPFISGSVWPAFEDLAQTVQQLGPNAIQTLANTAPNPGNPSRMASAILFFVAAMRGGDINSWLGEKTVNMIRKAGKGEILERLSRDITSLSRATAEPVSQDWRTLSLPLYWNGDIHKLQLYYRHDRPSQKDEDGNKSATGTRFIFDLELSRMGAVQLDGLHRPQSDGKGRLDLVLRTMNKIGSDMQMKMRQTYTDALSQAGITGELLFQDTPERFIAIKPENKAHETVI